MKKTISVAPMMDCTDRHERYFLSLISQKSQLYSEMIVLMQSLEEIEIKYYLLRKLKIQQFYNLVALTLQS